MDGFEMTETQDISPHPNRSCSLARIVAVVNIINILVNIINILINIINVLVNIIFFLPN